MYQKIIKNDIKKSRLITITITGFIILASLFTSLGVSLLINLFGAIDNLMLDAKAPYFIQMHSGDINQKRLEKFASDHKEVEELQVAEFLNFDGNDIVIGEESLSNSVQDNGLSIQNKKMDFLMDLNNKIIYPKDGEIYVSIYYMTEGIAKVGDTVFIKDRLFTVKGFLRDSQMNPSMSSSKRFLVSENDYKQLKGMGKLEYLIEFRFNKEVDIAKFESEYLSAGLEDNGPSGSYGLIKMMNGLTDGIVIAILILVSFLILIVTFLCVRFTLIAKIEEDYREIGVLKAIGIRVSEIKKLYIAKYTVISVVGCSIGFLISLFLQETFLTNIRLYMGRTGKEVLGILLGGFGALLIFIIVIFYINRVLNSFKKVSAVQAIRYGAPIDKAKASKGLSLSNNRLFSCNIFLGIKDVFSRKRLYINMLFVLIIACFIMTVPQNIHNTISDRSFMTYMGVGECDIRLDVHLVDKISEKTKSIEKNISSDKDIEAYSVFTCYLLDMPLEDGSVGKLKVELGDHLVFPLTYSQGREPIQENEIALSTLNGEELKKGIGDTIILKVNGKEKRFIVCGLYSDITNGGMTAKANFKLENERVLWSKMPIKLKDYSNIDQVIKNYKEKFSYTKISKMDEYMEQSLGTTMKAVQLVSFAVIGTSIVLTILITLLFMKMLVTKDRYQISVLKALGFTSKSIKSQYIVRSGIIFLIGIVIGTISANMLGGWIGSLLVSLFGVTTFHLQMNYLFAYLIAPLIIAICVYLATRFGISDIKSIKVSEYIKE